MAYIKRKGARKKFDEGIANAGATNFPQDGGIVFRIEIGNTSVYISQIERDFIVEQWAAQQKELEA